ncbi:serine/threonine protein phosphatase [Candidatus Bathyarchaeota archaeon]|nr:serine/threonine protein phosphatase [Candidatus Bathyarchaeota archaeon]
MNLTSIIKNSKTFESSDFVKTVESVVDLLSRESGKIGRLIISGHLVTLEPSGEALVIGDLHGDFDSLLRILQSSRFTQKLAKSKDETLIFLGDYGDRGANSAEVYYAVLKLKLAFPEQVVLLRGNHEGPDNLTAFPHDLPMQFQTRFKENWTNTYSKIRELFPYLYNAALVKGRCLMVHGGLSPNINSAQDLASAHVTHPKQDFLEDLLWSDPNDMIRSVVYSPRGAGKFFGKKITEIVLKKLGAKILIRGHEQCANGFKFNHDGKVLTLFSRRGAPYCNAYGAYLQLPLSAKFDNVQQLAPWIHKF